MINQKKKWVFSTDIDGTLTGDRESLNELTQCLDQDREKENLFLILCTGRTLTEVLEGQTREGIPLADAIVCQVGSEIFLPPFHVNMEGEENWGNHLKKQFSREFVVDLFHDIPFLIMQEERYNTQLKVSYTIDLASFPDKTFGSMKVLRTIQKRLSPYEDRYQIIYSSGKHLDVLPAKAGKGNAVRYLIKYFGLSMNRLVVAGDSGNDCSMFIPEAKGIVVNNAQQELITFAKKLTPHTVYFSSVPFAAGVLAGLKYFGMCQE
ncbi:MAG: HAD-IIB family hydrolase [SAR324 cluster bacterium]|nr:HAD-IIB family hydrolase [SAR324 cluster bacterium]